MTRAANLLLAVGVFGPPAAWFLTQQTQGGVVYFRCAAGGPPIGPLVGLVGAALCLLAGWLSWRKRCACDASSAPFLGQVALGAAAIFALANLATAAAAWIIPPCAR